VCDQIAEERARIGGEHPQELLSGDAYVCLDPNTLYQRTTDLSVARVRV